MEGATNKYISGEELVEIENLLTNSKAAKTDPELDNFLDRVDEVSQIVNGLSSSDSNENDKALRQADNLLQDQNEKLKTEESNGNDETTPVVEVTTDRTIINKPVVDEKPAANGNGNGNGNENENENGGDIEAEAFKKMVEKDAEERYRHKMMRKEKSDEMLKKGNQYFSKENYLAALEYYNQAINLLKDSPHLYVNRALTYIRLGIYSKAIEDCDTALMISENQNLRAKLFKAKAYTCMHQIEKAHECLRLAEAVNSESMKIIKDYERDLFPCNYAYVPYFD